MDAYFGLRSTGNTGRAFAPELGRDDLFGLFNAEALLLDEAVVGFDGRIGGVSLSESESEESDVELEDDEDDEQDEDEEDDEAEEEDVDDEEVEESESESDSLSPSDCLRDGPADGVAVFALTTGRSTGITTGSDFGVGVGAGAA